MQYIFRFILILAISLPCTAVFSQVEKLYDSTAAKATRFFNEEQYDSALLYYKKAVKLTIDNRTNSYLLVMSASAMLGTGNTYLKLQDAVNAHKYMTYSLQLARANKLDFDIAYAFIALNDLHYQIRIQNLPFSYPAAETTEETDMRFTILKAEPISKDSVRLVIDAGRLDGIDDSAKKGKIYSRYESKEKNRAYYLGNFFIRELSNNQLIAHTENDTAFTIRKGDIVEIKTRVPAIWRKLDVGDALLKGISFKDNYQQLLFHSRYLYYYADSFTNKELVITTKKQVDEIVTMLAEDTAKGDFTDVKGDKGIFAGENVMRAMSRSKEEHIKLFLEFANEYSRIYAGKTAKFSEAYANWVINNTPLASNSVMPWLWGFSPGDARQQMAFKISKDIEEDELIDKWLNNGMLMANADNTDSALHMASLLKDACIALKDSSRIGWAYYLQGYTEKRTGNYKKSDTLFLNALSLFKKNGNKEGEIWALNALQQFVKSREVSVTVQNGHTFSYLMAPSPNSKYLATGGTYDGMIKIWDIIQGRAITTISGHSAGINSINYSPNGRYLVTAADDQTIKVWNAYDFSLLNTIQRPANELEVIFTPDSKQLIAGGQDSLIKFIDINNGKVLRTIKKHRAPVTGLCLQPGNNSVFFSAGKDSMAYKWDINENSDEFLYWFSTNSPIMKVDVSAGGKYLALVCEDTSIRVWKLDPSKFYIRLNPHYSNTNPVDIAYPSFSPDGKYLAVAFKKDSLDIIDLSRKKSQVYGFKNEGNQGMFDIVFSPDGNYLAARMDLGGPIRLFNFSDWDYYTNPSLNTKDIKQYGDLALSVQFSSDDKSINILHEAFSKFDFRNGSTTRLFYGAFLFQNNYLLTNDQKSGFYAAIYGSALKRYDIASQKDTTVYALPDGTEVVERFELTASNKIIFLGGKKSTVAAYEVASGKMLFSKKYDTDEEAGIQFIRYDSLRKKLYVIDKNYQILVIDPLNGMLLNKIVADQPATIEVTPLYLYVTCDNDMVWKFDAKTFRLLKKIKVYHSQSDCFGSVMSYDYKYLVVQVADRFVTIDTRSDKVLYTRYDHDYANAAMAISHNNKLLATGGFDSKVNLYDLASGKKISTIHTPRGNDFMLVDSSGYYLAPKNTLHAVNFNFNNNSYGFEQFDSRFNRPHMALKAVGIAEPSLLLSYENAWKKRLNKLNISEKDLSTGIHLPVARLKDKFAIKPGTLNKEYELTVECFDAKYPLKSLQVLVNNNPVYGTAGLTITDGSFHKTLSVKVPLSIGKNSIKVYCTNSKGSASLAEYVEINGSFTLEKKPRTYFIGIAVSHYKDSSMNLRFAAKDVRDLATSFASMFKDFEVDTLIDQHATKENILALREKLMKTTVDDKVIISVNGHGLLNDSLDFYYATHDNNFSNPAARGLKYEDLEALLDGIPARKKLLLIDACHSGSLDKEELLALQKKSAGNIKEGIGKTDTVKGFAPRGSVIRSKKAKTDANSAYEVMQNLFADISSGNGSVIISAAGGMEYAFESDKWNNGVFTYCIRKGIEEEKADKEEGNGDRLVDVAELKNYVSRKVSELTNGRQKPVSRRENIEFNWVIW